MKRPTGSPCNECPWRRESLRGFLGPYDADEWIGLAHGDGKVACHLTIVEDDVEEGTTACSGAAIYRRNVAKSPRGVPFDHQLDSDYEAVFATPPEFIGHHKGPAK
jgi:hypothetical protein